MLHVLFKNPFNAKTEVFLPPDAVTDLLLDGVSKVINISFPA